MNDDGPPKLSDKEALVLHLLIASGAMYGLELVEDSDGELKRGTVYVTLSRMQDKGYVNSSLEDTPSGEQGPPRRKYKITALGRRACRAHHAAALAWRNGAVST